VSNLRTRVATLERGQQPTAARVVVLVLDETDPQSAANYERKRAALAADDFLVTIHGEDPDKSLEVVG